MIILMMMMVLNNQPKLNCQHQQHQTQTFFPFSAAKSAKIFVNFNSNNMYADDGPSVVVDKSKKISTATNSTTTSSSNLKTTTTFMPNTDKEEGGDNDGMSVNSDYSYRSRRLSGGTHHQLRQHHRHQDQELIFTPSQCKLKPAGFEFFDPKKQVNVINLQLNDKEQKMKAANVNCLTLLPQQQQQQQRSCHIKCKTRATQTLFRESSAQTLPYLPGVSNDPEELENLEIFKLPTILMGNKPPGLYEVEVLERARRRWSFAKALKENFRKQIAEAKAQAKLQQPEHVLEAFEWQHWIEREEYIQECQMLRLELLIRMFDRRERKMHTNSKRRIEKSCEEIEAKRRQALKKNEIEYSRALRRLEIKHNKQSRVWRKEHITQELGDPSSEFYVPKMRYGVNPSRRHYTASRKGFDMRMDDLEKKAVTMDPKNLKCPFAKLREWSKPKEVLQEVEQNFCTEENLKKLYESLRTLRETSRTEKYTPLCLKAKQPKTELKETTLEEKISQQMLDINITEEVFELKCSSRSQLTERKSSPQAEEDNETFEELKKQKEKERLNMEMLQKEMRYEELESLINSYEGNAIGWLMRFLTEEMSRLKEQRKLHFLTMLAKSERWHREAAEAGLRQKENFMREEYERKYEECNQVYKEMAKKYLNSILATDIRDYAEQEAEQHVTLMAKELDKEISSWLESFHDVQNPLNYHALRHALKDIVLPDIDKILYRLERDDCIDYIINHVILCKVNRSLESYDVSIDITNDFIDRLIDNDLYLNSPDCSSDCECTIYCSCTRARQEAAAIIRKVLRHAVPGRRWRTEVERVTFENIRELLDDIFDEVIAKGSIIDIDMINQPNVRDQKAIFDLIYSETETISKENSENNISLEQDDEVKIKRLTSIDKNFGLNITKTLKFDEQLLLIDPDNLSADKFIIHKDEYMHPEPQFRPRKVHVVPSTHDISKVCTFETTPIFAQTSSEELLEKMKMEEEEIVEEEEIAITERELSSETIESVEDLVVEEEFEFEEEIIIDSPKITDQTVHFSELPEEKIIEAEPDDDKDDDDDGVMTVSFSYDPNVQYSVPVPSTYDILSNEKGGDIDEEEENN
ncbi:uncharacterized protein ACRADG_005317 [Cochliomyia hominivorax]